MNTVLNHDRFNPVEVSNNSSTKQAESGINDKSGYGTKKLSGNDRDNNDTPP